MICQDSKCPDYLADDGEPAWCYQAGQPAQVAVVKYPKREDEKSKNDEKKNTGEQT
jgi:hypothetical protein